tara:strand:- start:707 stop:955 length:249 start_codon:yes stop_codon:yes gene_type:complete
MATATEDQTYTKPNPLDEHLNRNREEGLPFKVYEYKGLVSVETTLPFDRNRTLIDIYFKDTGEKMSRPDDWRRVLHGLIREG